MAFSAVSVIRDLAIAAMVVEVTKRIFTRPFQFRSSSSRPGSSPA